MNDNAPAAYRGLDRYAAREKVLADLQGPGPDRRGEAAQADGAALRAHRRRRRADADRPVVREDGDAGEGRAGRGRARRGPVRPRELDHHLQPVAHQHPGLVHLAPVVVGPPHPGLVRQRGQRLRRPQQGRSAGQVQPDAARQHEGGLESDPLGTPAGRGRARYLVLLRPVAVLDARLAGGQSGVAPLSAVQCAGDGLRHHFLLGGAHGDDDAAIHRQGAVSRGLRHGARARCRGTEDVEVEGQHPRSPGLDRWHRARCSRREAHLQPDEPEAGGGHRLRPPVASFPAASPPSAPTRCASPSRASPRTGATSSSIFRAATAIAISATSCGTPRATC